MEAVSSSVVGIDLGTTFSCVAHFKNNKAEVIPDGNGDRLIPSFVFYNPVTGEVSVGRFAYEQATIYPSNGLWDIKRIMGRMYDDQSLKQYTMKTQNEFDIVRDKNGLAAFQIYISGEAVIKSPEEVSAEILKYLKNSASSFLNEDVTEAVISIPGYFSNAQRRATRKAAELAGLTVLKLITEPTASAIHYIQNRNINSKLMVFDWGGGTLDISLVQVTDKTFEVKNVFGDTLLGGRNIDDILFKHFYDPTTDLNVPKSCYRYIRRLLHECTVLKEWLSSKEKVTKILDYINRGKDMTLSLTRNQFDDLTKDIFQRVLNIIEVGIDDSGWKKDDVEFILLVGGSSRIPKVATILKSFFNTDKIKTDLNPDEAVACGASIQAALLKNKFESLEKYHITEVTPLSLGLGTRGHGEKELLFFKFIDKNTKLPVSKTQSVLSGENNQTSVGVNIFEGERKNCMYNNLLGSFVINGLPPRRAGDVNISVKFSLDEDGVLTVTATLEGDITNSNTLVVSMGDFRLSEHKIEISIAEAKKHKYEDDVFEKFVLEKRESEKVCEHILFDIEKISSIPQRDFVKIQCENYLTQIEDLKYTDIEKLKGMFKVMYDSISATLQTFGMLTLPYESKN